MSVFGVEVPGLPAGYVPLEAVALVKCLDAEGSPTLVVRYSPSLTSWEAVGMLRAAEATELAALVAAFEDD